MESSAALAKVCVANGGVVSFRLADSNGISEQALIRNWHSGHLRKILPGVFCPAGAVITFELKVAAAALWAPRGVFCDRTAIWLYGLSSPPAVVEIATPTHRKPGVDWLLVRKVAVFGDLDIRNVGPYTVTSPCRTLIDACRYLCDEALQNLFDDAWRKGLLTPNQVEKHCMWAGKTRRGTARLRRIAADRMGLAPTDSRLEDRTVRLIRRWKLKEPLRQVVVHDRDGVRIKRMDLVYPDERIVIECDSYAHHNSDGSFHGDRDIWNRVEDAGYRIQWATWKNTKGDGRRFITQLKAKLADDSV